MKKLTPKELPNYIGKKIRVVYAVDLGLQGDRFVYGADITDEVTLKKFDPKNFSVTFERTPGTTDTKKPMLVLGD